MSLNVTIDPGRLEDVLKLAVEDAAAADARGVEAAHTLRAATGS